jgi:hypothetical protein
LPKVQLSCTEKGGLKGRAFVSILQLGSEVVLLLRNAQRSTKIGDGPINVAPSQK